MDSPEHWMTATESKGVRTSSATAHGVRRPSTTAQEPSVPSSLLGPWFDDELKKHTYHATIGKARQSKAKGAECPVHAYAAPDVGSKFHSAPASTTGSRTASRTASRSTSPTGQRIAASAPGSRSSSRRPSLSSGTPSRISSAPSVSEDGVAAHSFAATFGTTPTSRGELPKTSCKVHSYGASDVYLSNRTTTPSATFGTASAGRGLSPRAAARLSRLDKGTPLVGMEAHATQQRNAFHATFGRAPRQADFGTPTRRFTLPPIASTLPLLSATAA